MRADYRTSDWPERTKWSGDREAFRLEHGELPSCLASLERLQETASFQASQSGATAEIIDLGGDAPMWADNVVGSGD